jgi:hypothetical protein
MSAELFWLAAPSGGVGPDHCERWHATVFRPWKFWQLLPAYQANASPKYGITRLARDDDVLPAFRRTSTRSSLPVGSALQEPSAIGATRSKIRSSHGRAAANLKIVLFDRPFIVCRK